MEIKNGSMFVTGGCGFIGSHLVDRLVKEGCQVTVYDNLARRKNWIEPHILANRVRFIQADLLDRAALEEAMRGASVVWHLAGNTDIPAGVRDTGLDIKQAVMVTHQVLEAMRAVGVLRIMFTSSGAVYGAAKISPTPETYGPLVPLSLYAAGKLACEALISAHCSMFGIQGRIVRLGNVIGERMDHGVILDFIEKLHRDPTAFEILGDGSARKSYFLVEECIDALFFVFNRLFSDSPAYDIVNLAPSSSSPVAEIANIVLEEMGLTDAECRYTGSRLGWLGDQPVSCLDVQKINQLGWKTKHGSNEAVRLAVRSVLKKEEVSEPVK